ncbi:hypothetical protein N8837_01070 [Pseudomonadales bacterium]|nr:hypothetical protein [Pseudomonadales bacterium]
MKNILLDLSYIYEFNGQCKFKGLFIKLLCTSAICGLVDGAGLLLIMPILQVLLSDEPVIYLGLGENYVLGGAITFLVVRTLLISFLVSIQYKLVYGYLAKASGTIIGLGFSDVASKLKKEQVAQLAIVEVNNISIGVFLSMVNLITESIVVIVLLSISLFSAPTIFASAIGIVGVIIYSWVRYIRGKLQKYGKARIILDEGRLSYANFSVDGALELHAYNVVEECQQKFNELTRQSIWYGWIQQVIKNCQKYWIELSVILSLGFISILALFIEQLNSEIQTAGILIGLSAVKIIPSLNRISSYNQSINYFKSSVDKITGFLKSYDH